MIKHTPESPATRRVVVVGGGFGGFFATRELCRLKPGEAVVTLVSDTDAMLYQPLLPDVAVGALDPRRAAIPPRTTLRRARIVRGRALSVDTGRRSVEVSPCRRAPSTCPTTFCCSPRGP
jgi:NADH:ubiquinone reductase (H+-translocating)